jgi:hypothetical protein
MSGKVKFSIKNEKFDEFLSKLSDLTTISSTIKLKFDDENILMYSILGGSVVLAFKSYLLNTSEYFDINLDSDKKYDIIIGNCDKFVKNLKFLNGDKSSQIKGYLQYRENTSGMRTEDEDLILCRSIQLSSGKLKINWIGAEKYEIQDINKKQLASRLDIRKRKWSFLVSISDFDNIKKLSNINSDRIINVNVKSGVVKFSEKSSWELDVGEIEQNRDFNFIFNKRFFKCISLDEEHVEFSMFENFILIRDKESDLMLSYEQDFSDED